MAADLGKLHPDLQDKVAKLLESCRSAGVEMRPSDGLRDPFEQARLWRQSRSIEEISEKVRSLRSDGATFLAECIERVGPHHGPHVTNTPPGISWHQWGEALDCFWLVDKKAEWSARKLVNDVNGYRVYAENAEKIGITAGGSWSNFRDWPHIQLRAESNASKAMGILQIDREMRTRFDKEW